MIKRFLEKVEKTDSCWIWKGSRMNNGYGRICINYKNYRAHRLSYELFVGPIPKDLFVCHKCDVPRCVNPDHLFLGTHEDNVADQKKKGRTCIGQKNGRALLTSEQVLEIKKEIAKGIILRKIAEKYGVTRGAVNQIKRGLNWGHL